MIRSNTGIALRFLWTSKTITISSILTVALSIAIVLTMANLFANTQESINHISTLQEWTQFSDPVRSAELAAEYEHAQNNLGPLRTFIIILSLLTLVTGGLLAISNFDILHQRSKAQLAAMRAVGATPQQLTNVGIIQASLITAVGALLGLAATFATYNASYAWFEQAFAFSSVQGVAQFQMNTATILTTFILCAGLTLTLLMYPSLRLAKIVPAGIERISKRRRLMSDRTVLSIILVFMLAGLSFISLSLLDNVIMGDHVTVAGAAVITDNAFTVLVGSPLLIAALFMLLPFVLPPILEESLPFFRKVIGNASFVAVKNLIPQIQKSVLLMLLVSAVAMSAVFGSAFLETVRRAEHYNLGDDFPTDFILTGSALSPSTADPTQLRNSLLADPAIEQVSVVSSSEISGVGPFFLGTERGDDLLLSEIIVADLGDMQRQGMLYDAPLITGRTDDSMIVSWQLASLHDIRVGDILVVELFDESIHSQEAQDAREFAAAADPTADPAADPTADTDTPREGIEVIGIVRDFPGYGPHFALAIDSESEFFQNHSYFTAIDAVYVDGTDEPTVLAALAEVLQQHPELALTRLSAAAEAADQTFFQMWSIIIVVTAILLFCSVVGVFNTLMSHINQKRKEFAILRAVSVTESGVVKIVLTQVMLYVLSGLAFGGIMGILLTYLIIIMDPTQVYFNVVLLLGAAAAVILSTLIVFSFVAVKIGKLNPTEELARD